VLGSLHPAKEAQAALGQLVISGLLASALLAAGSAGLLLQPACDHPVAFGGSLIPLFALAGL